MVCHMTISSGRVHLRLRDFRAQVKYATYGIDGATWKRVESKDIAYTVFRRCLQSRAVVVVNTNS